jgi:hypothetical protein
LITYKANIFTPGLSGFSSTLTDTYLQGQAVFFYEKLPRARMKIREVLLNSYKKRHRQYNITWRH